MLTAHVILRHVMSDDYSIKKLVSSEKGEETYLKVLWMMHDNADGPRGAFSI